MKDRYVASACWIRPPWTELVLSNFPNAVTDGGSVYLPGSAADSLNNFWLWLGRKTGRIHAIERCPSVMISPAMHGLLKHWVNTHATFDEESPIVKAWLTEIHFIIETAE